MILYELTRFYNRLLDNPDIDICEPGFSNENISFLVCVDSQGKFQGVEDLRMTDGRNLRAQQIKVPKIDGKRAGKVLKPYYLWDNTKYVFGKELKGNKVNTVIENEEAFLAFNKTVYAQAGTKNMAIEAVLRFLGDKEEKSKVLNHEYWNDMLGTFISFRVAGSKNHIVVEEDGVSDGWRKFLASVDLETDQKRCLVSGQEGPVYPIHPTVKRGVGEKNDIPLVSFNVNCSESYGNKGNFNAPVTREIASKFTHALNYLIESRRHNLTIADTKTLFWAESNSPFEQFFGEVFDRASDEGFSADLKAFLDSVRAGRLPDQVKDASRFFVLGLAPNAARISVRFWHVDSVENFACHIGQHFSDLELVKQQSKDSEYPSLWQLLIETAPLHKTDNIQPDLAGPMIRSILGGTRYPSKILATLIERIRRDKDTVEKNGKVVAKDQKVNYYRASFLKAILNRNHNKELAMALDRKRTETPYCLGRLFAVLEKIQEDSAPGINSTIKDRYFATASTNPKIVFPRLISLSQNHLKKLKSEKTGLCINREKELGAIMETINEFPAALRLEEQGVFAIGYYHQRQSFF